MRQDKALVHNTAIQIVGKMLAVLFGIFTFIILSRHLGAAGFGELTIILGYTTIFAIVVDFGLTLTTVQMISEHDADENRLIGNLMSLRVISAITFLALAPVIALFIPQYDTFITIGIAIAAASFFFGTTSQLLVGVFQKRLIISRIVIAELVNRTVVLIGVILAPMLGFDVLAILWLFVVGNLLQLITVFLFARKHVTLSVKFEPDVWKQIISRSWPIGASILCNLIYLRGDILFLSLWRGAEEIGQYGAAYKVVDVITVVPVMYMGLILPMLVAAWSEKRIKTFNQTIQDAFDFFMIIAIPFAAGSIALGIPVMELMSGPEFTEAGRVLKILAPAASLLFISSLYGHAIIGVGKQKPMVLGYLFVAIITGIGYVAFIPRYGIWAAAWWTLIAEALIAIITFIVVARTAKHWPKYKMTARAFFASIIMFICLALLPQWHVLILVAIGCAVYYVALAALGGPKIKDVAKLFLPEKPPITQP